MTGRNDGLEYHTFLHHSQTTMKQAFMEAMLEYHTFLHHSQTPLEAYVHTFSLEYHTFLHHSQTSNSKMTCHHLHKLRHSNSFTTIISNHMIVINTKSSHKTLYQKISHLSLSIIYWFTSSDNLLCTFSINRSAISL